jgi:hypothetical protein
MTDDRTPVKDLSQFFVLKGMTLAGPKSSRWRTAYLHLCSNDVGKLLGVKSMKAVLDPLALTAAVNARQLGAKHGG